MKCPEEGRPAKLDTFERMRYVRLMTNTEIYLCMERAFVALDSNRKSRLGQFQIKGAERKKHTNAYDEETALGKVDRIYGKLERILADAAKTAGITKKQFGDWEHIGRVETRAKEGR